MTSYFKLIWRNGLRSRRRSLLTVFSGAASFCILGLLMAMYSLFFLTPPSKAQALRLIVRNRTSIATPIPTAYGRRISEVNDVREVMVQQWFGGSYKDPRDARNNFARFAVEPEKLFDMYPEFAIDWSQRSDFLRRQNTCILAKSLADRLALHVGDHIFLKGDIFRTNLNLTVSGFYDSLDDNEALYFHNEFLNQSLRERPNFAIMFMVLASRLDAVEALSRNIDQQFQNAETPTRTEPEKELQTSFIRFLGDIKLFLFAACSSLAATVMLVSANTVGMSVRERLREVGVLKTLGFSPHSIVRLIVGESALIALVGALLGFSCAQAIIVSIRRLPLMLGNLTTLNFPADLALFGLMLAVLLTAAAAFVPARQVSRRCIIDCLSFAD